MEKNNNLFSSSYLEINLSSCGREITSAIEQIKRNITADVKLYDWNDYVAVAFELKIDLPTRGTVGEIDIRSVEPVIFVFHKRYYPLQAPQVRSNRRDFPSKKLPHLIPVANDQPPCLCLHRGNIDDWFAEHTLEDLIKRAKGWFKDAACNRLIPEGDRFESTRPTDSIGSIVFNIKQLEELLINSWEVNLGRQGHTFLWMCLLNKEAENLSNLDRFPTKVILPIVKSEIERVKKVIEAINQLSNENDSLNLSCVGILCWSNKENNISDYFGQLPTTLEELLQFCQQYGFPLEQALVDYTEQNLHFLNGIPIIFAIKRPQPLINTESDIEFLCFLLNGKELVIERNTFEPMSAFVKSLLHRFPLIPERAAEIAGFEKNCATNQILFFGCGALGSKIEMHFGRSGCCNLTLVDYDELSPHNFVRHALLTNYSGNNKAKAVKKAINAIFDSINSNIVADSSSALNWVIGNKKEKLSEFNLLVDATASGTVFESLVKCYLPSNLQVSRCEISDFGNIGILYIEGLNRTPRLDDLQISLFDMAIDNTVIEAWLNRERKQREHLVGPVLDEIAIGISCASDTMRLSDDVVSLHAANISMALRTVLNNKLDSSVGYLYISHIFPQDDGFNKVINDSFQVKPFIIFHPEGEEDWQVRLHSSAALSMQEQMIKHSPNETGGLMIGLIHKKRRVIYVTRIIDAPAGSIGHCSEFKRGGIAKLPEELRKITQRTNSLLSYVGDWHSHPQGSACRSYTDLEAMLETKHVIDTFQMPTFILIVAPTEIKAYLLHAD
jgi:integrative and conjugative element protein (TIGR02256 family)